MSLFTIVMKQSLGISCQIKLRCDWFVQCVDFLKCTLTCNTCSIIFVNVAMQVVRKSWQVAQESSAIADGPRDALFYSKSCLLLHNEDRSNEVTALQSCSGAETRGDGVSPTPPLFRLKFMQTFVHCCNWLLTERQCKIMSVQHVCRPKLLKNICLSLVSGAFPPLLFRTTPL